MPKCQACKVENCAIEATAHPSQTALWNREYARKLLKVKKHRCEKHGGDHDNTQGLK